MTDHDTLEERLARSLYRRADGLHDAPLTLDAVRDRAHGIRRRRRALTAGTAAAVVLAIAIPLGLASGGRDDSRGVDPAPRPELTRATVLDTSGDLTLPDGSVQPVPFGPRDTEIAVLEDGRVVGTSGRALTVVDGPTLTSYRVALNDLVVTSHGAVAWIGADQRVRVLQSGLAEPVVLAAAPDGALLDAVIGEDCRGDGCQVYVGDGNRITHRVYADETVPLDWDPPFTTITDANLTGDRWVVELPRGSDEQFACAAIYRPVEAEVTAQNCDTSGLRFSPDEQHLLGMRGDNNMYGDLTVLDADLQPVLAWEPATGQAISRATWADPTHLEVAVVDLDTSTWSLLRVALDGTSEVLDGPTAGGDPEDGPDYLFAQ